jgi:hypothetical protein
VKKVGVKMPIVSIVSIVSTRVAPRLHHLHKKEGQFGILLFKLFWLFFVNYSVLQIKMVAKEGFEFTTKGL